MKIRNSSGPFKNLLVRGMLPYAVLLFGALLTGTAAILDYKVTINQELVRFESQANQAESRIRSRIEKYQNALIHTRAFFLTQSHVSRQAFRDYVRRLELSTKYPGIQGLGFTVRIPAEELQSHERKIQAGGFPEYEVWPDHPREEYYSILYLEPFEWRNQRAFGYDMFTDPIRKKAMELARDTGEPALSGKVILVQETEKNVQPGFLLYVPIYDPKLPADTVEQRRKALTGYIYAPFRSGDLFARIFDEDIVTYRALDVEVFDTQEITQSNILYDKDGLHRQLDANYKPRFRNRRTIHAKGRDWTVLIASLPEYEKTSAQTSPFVIGLSGLSVSLLMFLLLLGNKNQTELERAHLQRIEGFLAERKRNEDELRKALRARDEFLSIASHELRTPLTPLQLQLQSLIRLLRGEPNLLLSQDRLIKIAAICENQISRMSRLVDDLLDVSRITSGKLTIKPTSVDLSQIIHETVERFKSEIAKAGCTVYVCVPEVCNAKVDHLRIEQVLSNLITNATKYAHGGRIDISLNCRDDQLQIEVQDQGAGIAKEDQIKIFDRFERVGTEQKNIGGLGLGLYITRQIVESHQGTIRIESEPGKGSRFIVSLPRTTAKT